MSTPGSSQLDALLQELEHLAAETSARPPDAIDEIRRGPRRRTSTRSIRHDPALENFRRELSDGLIRADTANQLLRLITSVLAQLA